MSGRPTNIASSVTATIRQLLERYNLPGFDLEAFIQGRQADIDAVSRSTAIAFTGAQTITEKQVELLKATLDQLNEALSSRASAGGSGSVEEVAKKQRDLMQSTLTSTLEGMREMAEAAQRAQTEIFDIGLERARSNAEQMRTLLFPQKK